jgi:hypothetical protein
MSDHRFKIGETVRLRSAAARVLGTASTFTIVATLPRERGLNQYRLCCEVEKHERVVTEDDIELVMHLRDAE